MAINPGSNINNTFDSLYNNKSSGKEERKKRQFKFILHQLELRINIYIYIHAELLADTNFPLIRTRLGQNSWLQIDQSVRILMSDSAPTYVCARAHACRGARCARARARWNSKFRKTNRYMERLRYRSEGHHLTTTQWDRARPFPPLPAPSVSFQSRDLHLSLHPFPSQHLTTTAQLPSLSLSLFRATFFPVAARQSRTLDVA